MPVDPIAARALALTDHLLQACDDVDATDDERLVALLCATRLIVVRLEANREEDFTRA